MKKLLNVDDGWLAGIQNCPPQGNLGGGVDEVFNLEAMAQMAGGPGWVWCGIGVDTDSKFLIDRVARIVMKADNAESYLGGA